MKLDGLPTEEVPALAQAIERHGLEEVWICEDLGLNGGIAQSAIALSVTERIRVGHGIAPAAIRNVAYYAMEVASLCRTFPGRFLPGLGHGMPGRRRAARRRRTACQRLRDRDRYTGRRRPASTPWDPSAAGLRARSEADA
jgi:alkanesulfonate monooxygenase SsuD/methylene tetrahydromethanopterin reductase-like flavin-dependent oxidoreductase (luciferase family)